MLKLTFCSKVRRFACRRISLISSKITDMAWIDTPTTVRIVVSCANENGLVVTSTPFEPACWTVASTLKVSISFWTAVAWTGFVKARLYWSPPAKSIPSRKPKTAIEIIPGRMIASESRKYQLRRPTIFIAAPLRRLGRRHAVERQPAGRLEAGNDLQELLGGDDGREHTDRHTDRERDREAFDQRGAKEVQDEAGNQRRDVGIADRRPGAVDAGFHRRPERAAGTQLFLDTFEDQHVGVDRHTDREDEAGETRECQRDAEELEDGQRDAGIEEQRDAGHNTRQPVVEEHEQDDDRQSKGTGQQAQLDRRGTQGGAHL